jgi:hypothetical protein
MNSLNEILEIAPPPEVPYALDFAWQDVESHLSIALPGDFKALVLRYGRGVFQPSWIRLCNYLDSQTNDCDQFIEGAQSDAGASEKMQYPMFPEVNGLLPFASYGSEDYFFWNVARSPWSIVCVRQNGLVTEEVEGLTTSDFLLRAFHLDPDQPIRSIAKFILEVPPKEPAQGFHTELHETRIDPEVCRIIAQGGQRSSYRIRDVLDITLSQSLKLHRANRDPVLAGRVLVSWDWSSPKATASLAPECSIDFHLTSQSVSIRSLADRSDELFSGYYAQRINRKRGSFDLTSGTVFWIQASAVGTGNEIAAHEVVFLGAMEQNTWEMYVHVKEQYLAHFFAITEQAVKSIRRSPSQ